MADGFIRAEVKGLKELEAALKALPPEIAGRSGGPLRAGVRKMGDFMALEIRRAAEKLPVSNVDGIDDYERTSRLARSVRVSRDQRAPQGTERVWVKPRSPYYVPVEFGTEKMPARPFVRPTFEARYKLAIEVFRLELGKAIERAARKVAKLRASRG